MDSKSGNRKRKKTFQVFFLKIVVVLESFFEKDRRKGERKGKERKEKGVRQ